MDIRPSIEFAAAAMEDKLQKNDHKGAWENPTINIWHLFDRMKEEVAELEITLALYQADSDLESINNVISECADVCNFAHMIMSKVCKTMSSLERGKLKK